MLEILYNKMLPPLSHLKGQHASESIVVFS